MTGLINQLLSFIPFEMKRARCKYTHRVELHSFVNTLDNKRLKILVPYLIDLRMCEFIQT